MNKRLIIGLSILGVAIVCGFIFFYIRSNTKTAYQIDFNTDGGSIVPSQTIEEGNVVTIPTDPTKDGYKFVEWQLNEKAYDFNLAVNSDLTLTAKWIMIEEESFIVKFNSDGGSVVENQVIKSGEKLVKPDDPTKDGYVFKYWSLNNEEFKFDEEVTSDITLTAVWEKKESSSESKSNNNNNNNNNNSNNNNNKSSGEETNKSSGNNETSKVKVNYTVSFNSNGGTSYSSQTVVEGNKASNPGTPTKEGYTFNNWMLGSNVYDFNSAVSGNITLTASWTQKTYTITVSKVDEYSPDRILSVKENGSVISVNSIKFNDGSGIVVCYGSNMTVSASDIAGESSFIVVLSGGTQVTATIQ